MGSWQQFFIPTEKEGNGRGCFCQRCTTSRTQGGAKSLELSSKAFRLITRSNHINKLMAIAFTAFAFVDCIDDGGCAERLALKRAQGKKVAVRMQRNL
jgi:hypothetical protein